MMYPLANTKDAMLLLPNGGLVYISKDGDENEPNTFDMAPTKDAFAIIARAVDLKLNSETYVLHVDYGGEYHYIRLDIAKVQEYLSQKQQ